MEPAPVGGVAPFMQYVIYFAVATPLLLAWLFWTADRPALPPLFNSGIDHLHVVARPPVQTAVSSDLSKHVARETSTPRNE